MATNDRALMAAEREVQNYKDRIKRWNEKNKTTVQQVVGGTIAAGSAFGFGYVQGRYPDRAQVGGLPVSLVAGGILTVGTAMGWIPEAEYLGPVGVGGLACFGALEGLKKGQEAAQKG